ncbi:hypothetical protein Nepgr_014507 [Nepenthes gracilis]|uniref:Uncharacterized protein n=1 Tax=Nepenthes gracilis TaxID=150966 RepID=A0AAD3SLA6_NEPGR|nr:hypothetical protein Nepgr_014507 [Nepenthes gracilis]
MRYYSPGNCILPYCHPAKEKKTEVREMADGAGKVREIERSQAELNRFEPFNWGDLLLLHLDLLHLVLWEFFFLYKFRVNNTGFHLADAAKSMLPVTQCPSILGQENTPI